MNMKVKLKLKQTWKRCSNRTLKKGERMVPRPATCLQNQGKRLFPTPLWLENGRLPCAS